LAPGREYDLHSGDDEADRKDLCDGIEDTGMTPLPPSERLESADRFVTATGATIHHGRAERVIMKRRFDPLLCKALCL
jgi:hypothetical protein